MTLLLLEGNSGYNLTLNNVTIKSMQKFKCNVDYKRRYGKEEMTRIGQRQDYTDTEWVMVAYG